MNTPKQEALEAIGRMPDSVSREAIIERLQFVFFVLKRAEEAEHDENLIPHEEVERTFGDWLRSAAM
jgi:hypothetical protein